ncbi:hypothetical protein [Hydrotalea sp. AMD]|nr:hypothetical protein [Hydrotalea sp. AMD]
MAVIHWIKTEEIPSLGNPTGKSLIQDKGLTALLDHIASINEGGFV